MIQNILQAFITERTCGEACWHAVEDVCHCSCGGRNHGCLRSKNGVQPERMSKIDGIPYVLKGVGDGVYESAIAINQSAGYKSIEPARRCTDHKDEVWYNQYYYCWSVTDTGAPARLKYANKSQVERWPELAAYRGQRETPRLLWVRIEMPTKPDILRVDSKTGLPLADQTPPKHW